MKIVKWVPDDEIAALWERWVHKQEEGSGAVQESQKEDPGRDEPPVAETLESPTRRQII